MPLEQLRFHLPDHVDEPDPGVHYYKLSAHAAGIKLHRVCTGGISPKKPKYIDPPWAVEPQGILTYPI